MGKTRDTANLISDGNIFVDITNDRVGIGSTVPVSQLNVRNGPAIIGAGTSTGTASQTLQVTGGAYVSGNLGIGTTNPIVKLDIVGGNLSAGGGVGDAYFYTYADFSGANVSIEAINRANTIKKNLTLNAYGGNVLVGTSSSTGTASQPLQVTGGGYFSGFVGIGTTRPTVNLQLSPTASISNVGSGITLAGTVDSALTVAQFFYSNTNSSYLRIKATRNTAGSDWTTASTKLLQVIDVTEQGYVEFNPNGSLYGMAFGQGGTEWARFLSSGNLGIGITNPQGTLQVGTAITMYASTGIVSATSYRGDGSQLTGVSAGNDITSCLFT